MYVGTLVGRNAGFYDLKNPKPRVFRSRLTPSWWVALKRLDRNDPLTLYQGLFKTWKEAIQWAIR